MSSLKYAVHESERRFLVIQDRCANLTDLPRAYIEDRYIVNSHLRLRIVRDEHGRYKRKLCKKYESDDAYATPITNIYVSEEEYKLLKSLPALTLRKIRDKIVFEGNEYSIDVFEDDLAGLVLSEIEAHSREELLRLPMPPWADREVTTEAYFRGGHLATVHGQSP